MKTKILSALLIFSLVWAVSVTVLYWKLKNNPRVVAVTMNVGQESLQNLQLGEMEKLTFLRQYLDRFFNYDSNNFWQSQTSLAFLMAPALGEERVREVSRLRAKIQQKNFSQLGKIQSLRQTKNGAYEALVHLQTMDGATKNTSAKRNDLYVTVMLTLINSERTLENPWGLLVQSMNFANSTPQEPPFQSEVFVQAKSPTLVTFPCAIENIENPDEKNLSIKITTLNVSELQVSPAPGLQLPVKLNATCKDSEFAFELKAHEEARHLFVAFPVSAGQIRKKETPKIRKKDVYEKTIENVLGIELDN
ncbi:hypothetical protein QJS83_13015 [Bdellovibrio sp. 22V]|uniref:hypothetical protein n=1 Tax=Bdellovibrio sp. 22V TaxID=3044166 RepID=UPI002542B578|nr:hypothetical protein [Bdellovibrio sp. 22V]WII71383.1 hypothetical protein QJS83_13015 [Bdellovibrio sp. 22V]